VATTLSLDAATHLSISLKCEVDLRFRAPFRCNHDSPPLATSVLYPHSVGGEYEQQLRGDCSCIPRARLVECDQLFRWRNIDPLLLSARFQMTFLFPTRWNECRYEKQKMIWSWK